jgi:hypothetical protein
MKYIVIHKDEARAGDEVLTGNKWLELKLPTRCQHPYISIPRRGYKRMGSTLDATDQERLKAEMELEEFVDPAHAAYLKSNYHQWVSKSTQDKLKALAEYNQMRVDSFFNGGPLCSPDNKRMLDDYYNERASREMTVPGSKWNDPNFGRIRNGETWDVEKLEWKKVSP